MNKELEERFNMLRADKAYMNLSASKEEKYCDYTVTSGNVAEWSYYANEKSLELSEQFDKALSELIKACE